MKPSLSSSFLLKMYHLMVKARLIDEQLIQLFKKNEAPFWIGSPGQEALEIPLGLLVNKGQGLKYDWLHLHYRCTGTVVAMGLESEKIIQFMMNKKTEPFTGGRNFIHHYSIPEWNIPPISSIVESQHSLAIGTALAQSQEKNCSGITIVTGGDAGTALGDFATSLIWSSRPNHPLPLLILVLNNRFGISTNYESQHAEKSITDRAKAFGIRCAHIDGNNPVESYLTLKENIEYIRKKRKPVLIEASVSRLYGHSSSSGAQYDSSQTCSIEQFEKYLLKHKISDKSFFQKTKQEIQDQLKKEISKLRSEQIRTEDSAWSFIYARNENADWRKF